jgi:UDP-glucose:(heptosyl)LPS alpha-1,3-glucosyltransferase
MRIALVHRRFTTHGGTERYLVGLTEYLVRAGHEVHVYSNEIRKDLRDAMPEVTFHYMPIIKLGGLLKVVSLCLSAHMLVPRQRFDIVQGFGRTLVQDVMRAGGGCHHVYFKLLQRESTRFKRFLLWLSLRHRFTLWVERFQYHFPHYRRIIAVSGRVRDELIDTMGVDPKRVEVVYNGVDLDRFNPGGRVQFRTTVRKAHGVPEEAHVALFLGTGYRRKGLFTALRAFSQVANNRHWMMVVGRDTAEAQYRHLARILGIDGRVVFCGPTSEPERYYAAADVFVLPTRYEPFGNVCLEAMAAGLPVITTAVNGAAEVFPPEVLDLVLSDPQDVDGFAVRLEQLLSNPDSAFRLGKICRHRVEALTREANGRKVEMIYRKVLAEKGGTQNEGT